MSSRLPSGFTKATCVIGADCSVPSYIGLRARRMSQFEGSSPITRGVTRSQPSVTSYVTWKLALLLAKSPGVSPIAVVPASVRDAAAVPLNTVSAAMS